VGTASNAASARAAISAFMTRLHLWTIVLIWTSAPRPIGRRLRETCQGLRSHAVMRITAFRTIQNDSGRSDWPASAKSSTAVQTSFNPQFSGGVAAGLSEHDGKPFKNVGPVAARQLHKFRFCRVRQAKFAPAFAYIQFNGYALKIEGIFLGQKC